MKFSVSIGNKQDRQNGRRSSGKSPDFVYPVFLLYLEKCFTSIHEMGFKPVNFHLLHP